MRDGFGQQSYQLHPRNLLEETKSSSNFVRNFVFCFDVATTMKYIDSPLYYPGTVVSENQYNKEQKQDQIDNKLLSGWAYEMSPINFSMLTRRNRLGAMHLVDSRFISVDYFREVFEWAKAQPLTNLKRILHNLSHPDDLKTELYLLYKETCGIKFNTYDGHSISSVFSWTHPNDYRTLSHDWNKYCLKAFELCMHFQNTYILNHIIWRTEIQLSQMGERKKQFIKIGEEAVALIRNKKQLQIDVENNWNLYYRAEFFRMCLTRYGSLVSTVIRRRNKLISKYTEENRVTCMNELMATLKRKYLSKKKNLRHKIKNTSSFPEFSPEISNSTHVTLEPIKKVTSGLLEENNLKEIGRTFNCLKSQFTDNSCNFWFKFFEPGSKLELKSRLLWNRWTVLQRNVYCYEKYLPSLLGNVNFLTNSYFNLLLDGP